MKKNYGIFLLLAFLVSGIQVHAQDYTSLINDYLKSNQRKLGISAEVDWKISSQTTSKKTGLTQVYAQQLINGIEVQNAISTFTIKSNKVIYDASRFINSQAFRANTGSPSLNASEAVARAVQHLKLGRLEDLRVLDAKSSHSFILSEGNVSFDPIPVQLVYIKKEGSALQLAWNLSIHELSGEHWWSVSIDAQNGEIVSLNDWVLSCNFGDHNHNVTTSAIITPTKQLSPLKKTANSILAGERYRVFPLPLTNPFEGPDQLLTEPQNTTASPFGWHDTDGQPGAEFTITRGNNVYAFEDIDGSGGSEGDSPNGGTTLNFDFPVNLQQTPREYLKVSTTNLFYVNNIVHDIVHFYGFDEASGNFQQRNYSAQGMGTDFVRAISQDGTGLNNATFATPPDGSNPRMRMFLWSATGPPGQVLFIESPASLAGGFVGIPAALGKPLTTKKVTGNLILVNDNNSSIESTDPNDGCDTFLNGGALSNNIAVIRRGTCNFEVKIKKAQDAGAKAVIIVNNTSGLITIGGTDSSIFIPSVMITQEDGERIITALKNGTAISGFLQNNGPFQKDGSLDNGIIIHEYAHGISNRLTGGANAADCLKVCTERDAEGNCVATSFTEQMGEGWSDYLAIVLTIKPEDNANTKRPIGTFVTADSNDAPGIRPAPYTRDMSVNNFTYGNTNSGLSVPHGVGFVWASMLWDLTWDLIDFEGFDPDLYTGKGGNNIALQLVMEGMKIQPCQPGFVDGRDAILEADRQLYGGRYQCVIWKAFAKRGLGRSARQGDPAIRGDQTEAFDVPAEFSGDCVLSVEEEKFGTNSFKIFPNPSSGRINLTVTGNYGEGEITIFDLNGRKVVTQKEVLTGKIELNANNLATGVYLIQIKNDSVSQTQKLIIR